jgi:DNA-binding response OmpR family regulator
MYGLNILVADDDREITNLIADCLEDEGLTVTRCYTGREALDLILAGDFSLIILDVMMPEMDGLEVCRRIRQQVLVPILLLTAKGREMDRVVGFEVGADDYITKPFSINELTARVKAHLRREARTASRDNRQEAAISFDDITVHPDSYEVDKNGARIELSTKEFQVLAYLLNNHNQVLSREQIYQAVWGPGEFGDLNTVTVHIANLRKKLDPAGKYIKTVWGAGYKFSGGIAGR